MRLAEEERDQLKEQLRAMEIEKTKLDKKLSNDTVQATKNLLSNSITPQEIIKNQSKPPPSPPPPRNGPRGPPSAPKGRGPARPPPPLKISTQPKPVAQKTLSEQL